MSSDNFEKSIAFSLKWEGGRNFDVLNGQPVVKGAAKADLGGATAYGIIVSTLKAAHAAGVVDHEDITRLTQDEAKLIYKRNFWDKYGWGELAWPACLCCLDCSINHGGFAFILQRAAVDCGQSVTIDGKFGPKTFAALKACEPVSLSRAIVNQRKAYYDKIVAKNPSQRVFMTGWLRRANDMAEAAGLNTNKSEKLSEHFSRKEFRCHCGCGFDDVSPLLIEKLEKFREACGNKPMKIGSGCRCAKRNAAVGGTSDSQHVKGTAADVYLVPGLTTDQMAKIAEQVGFDGIGKYRWGVHVDVRGSKARWDYRGK
ncbi:MAG: hypothetical protein IJ667_08085 [Synergistaceae bacterium]|nr:hypothetical protein [Synergistaceae bacterium]